MNKYTPLLTRCRVATQNANAAELLYRIAFWMPKATVVKGGRKWVANSAVQWTNETGLTLDQYRRAIARLKKLGFVETEQHLFWCKNVTHVRLTEQGCAAIEAHPLDQGTAAPPASANSAQPEKCDSAQLYLQGESDLESHLGESNKAFASAHANCLPSEQEVSGENKSNSKPVSKKNSALQNEEKFYEDLESPQINSIDAGVPNYTQGDSDASTESLAPSSANPIAPPVPMLQPNKKKDPNAADLAARWEALIIEHYGDYVPPFTKKEFGQLKAFVEGCPPGQALSILERCLRDWSGFTVFAKAQYGAFPLPLRPTLDFLIKYRAAAINFALEQAKKAAIPKGVLIEHPKKKPVAPAFKPTIENLKPKHVKATVAEMQAILSDDDSGKGSHAGTPAEHKKNEKPKKKGLTHDQILEMEQDEYYGSLDLPK